MSSVTEDSRRVLAGGLFVAIRGGASDGHAYAEAAVAAGAAAILGDRPDLRELAGLPYLFHPAPRRAAGLAAHALAGNPTRAMTVAGVTGTNGKSSTVYLSRAIFQQAGRRTAALGTLGYELPEERIEAAHTTPFGEELAAVFSRARAAGVTHAAMEVSSHALDQERVAGIHFSAAAFTNLTQDHLDYHHDMERYGQAKLKLFERLDRGLGVAVVNAADPWAARFLAAAPRIRFTFGKGGDCRASEIRMDSGGAAFVLHTPWGRAEVRLALIGHHNVSNALCAAAIAGGLGFSIEEIAAGLESLRRVPGRFEKVDAGQDFLVVVDYAHTEDGLRNVLDAARRVCGKRVIVVFGCGGDRDKGKRPKMGAAAATLADFAILTSDNPRTEDPHRILLDVEVGMQRAGKRKGDDYLVIADRAGAIQEAIRRARRGDLVLIAGKGHEDYQILGTTRIHFDDCEVARAALEGR